MFDLSNDKLVQEKYPLDTQDLEQMSHKLDRCLDHIRGDKLKEDFARVAPYMVADILEAAFAGKVTVVQTVKNNLLTGMFKVGLITILLNKQTFLCVKLHNCNSHNIIRCHPSYSCWISVQSTRSTIC